MRRFGYRQVGGFVVVYGLRRSRLGGIYRFYGLWSCIFRFVICWCGRRWGFSFSVDGSFLGRFGLLLLVLLLCAASLLGFLLLQLLVLIILSVSHIDKKGSHSVTWREAQVR